MAKTAEITSLLSKKNFVFDPYNIKSYSTSGKLSKLLLEKIFINVQPDCILHGYRMKSNGLFESCPKADSAIYVYKVQGHVAVLKLSEYVAACSAEDGDKAFAFFDKELGEYLENTESDNKSRSCKIKEKEIYKTEYLCWHYGTIFNNEMNSKKDWIVVPREIFTDVDDYVYLCICASDKNKPELKKILFPKDCLFFYDLPVATSVYEGQKLGNSKIILGRVMAYLPKTKGIPLSLCGYKECKGKFEWKNKTEVVKAGVNKTVKITQRNDYNYIISGKKISCPPIELYVYKKSPADRQKDITAFVWHSGNEDDIVKKEYLGDDSYNKYSYIQDCLSSDTMYHSYVSLTRLTGENAARYAVRSLAHQPEGNRCFSIDSNHLVYLMGGAIYKIESLVVYAYDANRNLNADEIGLIEDLYKINNSHLFFDSPITYDYAKWQGKALYYLHNVLGIGYGESGCEAIRRLLYSLFYEISYLGINMDYVYCDIEGPWNDARMLASRRFSPRYLVSKSECEDTSRKFYEEVVWEELKGRNSLWKEMLQRGYTFGSNGLENIINPNDVPTDYRSNYGVNRSMSYAERRNLNVWDAVMKGYSNEMFYKHILKPVMKCHQSAKCSVYAHSLSKGYVNRADRFETYLGGTVNMYEGVYSSGSLYGSISGEYYKKLCMDNWKMYPNEKTVFSYFTGNINKLRSLLLSTQNKTLGNGKFNVFISSFNIWVNGYQADDIKSEQVAGLIAELKSYYREYLYHIFLCCPDKAIAYFNVEKKYQNAGNYYFPFGKNKESIFEKDSEYYKDSYVGLQNVLEELNNLIKGDECTTMVKCLTTETSSYVISGIRCADRILWRLTLDSTFKINNDKGIGVTVELPNNQKIMFAGGSRIQYTLHKKEPSNLTKMERSKGLWICTSVDVSPRVISKKRYFEDNPAYLYRKTSTEKLPDEMEKGETLRYKYAATHTVFGEAPKFQSWSMKFRVKEASADYARLLWSSNFRTSERASSFFEICLGQRDGKGNGLTIATWKNGRQSKKCKEELIKDKLYELKCYIHFVTEISADLVKARVRYELWKLDEKEKPIELLLEDEGDIQYDNANNKPYFVDCVEIINPYEKWNLLSIDVEEFKIYFSQQHEKIELFRERDGVNVSRVNRFVESYEDLPVYTRHDDVLIAKFSWLNATDEPVEYNISFYIDDKKQRLDSGYEKIKADANSEGYRLIPLPELKEGASSVRLVCEKPKKEMGNTLEQELTDFFVNAYNKECTKEIRINLI